MSPKDSDLNRHGLYIYRLIEQRIGQQYMHIINSLDVPRWFRGLSEYQMATAEALSNALRDDMEQRTTYRVQRTIVRLGLFPKPNKASIRLLMRMSRGNDLAFLWFLMEHCYKSAHSGETYNNNEQIIMSAIYQLDLGPTLRALDRVLPLGQEAAEKDKPDVRPKRHVQSQQRSRRSSSKPKLPYFEEPKQPKKHFSRLVAEHPRRPPLVFDLPKEQERTLWSRWFGGYQFNESKRIAKPLLNSEIDRIISSFQTVSLDSEAVRSLCMQHKQISDLEQSLKSHMEAMKLLERQKWADVRSAEQKRCRERVLGQLEQATAHFEAKFHDMATRTRLTSTRKELYAQTKLHKGFSSKPDIICQRLSGGEEKVISAEDVHVNNCRAAQGDCRACDEPLRLKLLRSDAPSATSRNWTYVDDSDGFCAMYDPGRGLLENAGLQQRKSSLARFLHLQHSEAQEKPKGSTTGSARYFEFGSSGNEPKFNYAKLFDCSGNERRRLDNEEERLKAAFIAAINSDVGLLTEALGTDLDSSIDAAVDRAAKKIFKESSDIFRQEYNRLLRRQDLQNQQTRMNFGQHKIDANNVEQMKKILRLGLDRVGEDRRYVLPTLPNVEHVPFLVEWVSTRYGKRYSERECMEIHEKLRLLIRHLTDLLKRHLVPSLPDVHHFNTVEFSSRKCLRRMAKAIRSRYKSLFCQSIMEVGRIFYFAMRPQVCGTVPVSTFYAYMPAHFRDTNFSVIEPRLRPNDIKQISYGRWIR